MIDELEYVPGDAWAIVTNAGCAVFTRALVAGEARALRELIGDTSTLTELVDRVGAHPYVLALLASDGESMMLLRRRGVPATTGAAMLADAFGDDWHADRVPAGAAVQFGDVTASADEALPLTSGIVRVRSVLAATRAPSDEVHDDDVIDDRSTEGPAPERPVAGAHVSVTIDRDTQASDASEARADQGSVPEASQVVVPDETTVLPAAAGHAAVTAPSSATPDHAAAHDQSSTTGEDHAIVEHTLLSSEAQVHRAADVPEHTLVDPLERAEQPPRTSGIIDSVPGFVRPAAVVNPTEHSEPSRRRRTPAVDDPERAAAAPSAAPASASGQGSSAAATGGWRLTAGAAPVPEPFAAQDAQRDVAPAPRDEVAAEPTALGDHDGFTVTPEQARRLREQLAAEHAAQSSAPHHTPSSEPLATSATPTAAPSGIGDEYAPLVPSVLCPSGHVNPAGLQRCRVCGAPVDRGTLAQRPRPNFAALRLPNGDVVALDRGVVLGRRPRAGRIEQAPIPRLVAVASPNEDISRSHVRVICEDWTVIATDLDSTNGTVLIRHGVAPMRLRANEPTILVFGDVLDLGDGATIRLEPSA